MSFYEEVGGSDKALIREADENNQPKAEYQPMPGSIDYLHAQLLATLDQVVTQARSAQESGDDTLERQLANKLQPLMELVKKLGQKVRTLTPYSDPKTARDFIVEKVVELDREVEKLEVELKKNPGYSELFVGDIVKFKAQANLWEALIKFNLYINAKAKPAAYPQDLLAREGVDPSLSAPDFFVQKVLAAGT